jgi:hypothetical protein
MSIVPSSVPILFIISVYLDNDWDNEEQEEALLDFLMGCLLGEYGLPPDSLTGLIELMASLPINLPHEISNALMEQVS